MIYKEKELLNISNSLKHWNISEGQKNCVFELIDGVRQLKEVYKDRENDIDFYWTILIKIGQISKDESKKADERIEEIYEIVKSIIEPNEFD